MGAELQTQSKKGRGARRGRAVSCHGRSFKASELAELAALGADWLWESDAGHRLSWVSDNFEAATGVPADQLIGRSRLDSVGNLAEPGEGTRAHLAALTAHDSFRDVVYELNEESEHCRWVAVSGTPLFDPDGVFIGYRGTGRNVTQFLADRDKLRKARRELSLREGRDNVLNDGNAGHDNVQRVMAALDVMQDAFCYYDRDDRLVLYNRAMVDMYAGMEDVILPGISFAALLDAGLARDLWNTDGLSKGEWRERLLAARKEKAACDTVISFRDGRWIMHREQRTGDGGRIGICTDITAIKHHQAEVEAAREEAETLRKRLQAAIDALKDGFVLWDADDRLVVCNDAFRSQFSHLPALREGRTFSEMFLEFVRTGAVPEAIGREEEWVREQSDRRAEELGDEFVFHTHDGRWMMRRDQLTATGDRVGIRTDITAHKEHEAALARAKEESEQALWDLEKTVDAMRMGVVVVDKDLNAGIINTAYYRLWNVSPEEIPLGSPARRLMEVTRQKGNYKDVAEDEWQDYVDARLEEIARGDVSPCEFRDANGRTLIYSVTSLSGGKRLVTYYDITDMKRREAELAEATEKAKLAEAVIDNVSNPIFVKDTNLRFVLANKAFAALFKAEPQDLVGRKGGDLVAADEAARFEESERSVLETGEPYEVEEDFELDGLGHTRLVRKHKVRTASGKDYVACTIFDVSEIKQREMEAQEARRQLANVLETLPAAVVIYDREDRFVLANRKAQDALPALIPAMRPGSPLREAVELAHDAGYFRETGEPALDRLYDTDREAWIDRYTERYRARHRVFERENPGRRWVKAIDTRTEDGSFVGVRVDITEIKEREAALKQSMRENELFKSLIDNVPVAIYAKQPDLRTIYVNKGWCELTGRSKEEAIGRTDEEVFGGDGRIFAEGDRAVLETGERQEIEETWAGSDGSVHYWIARKHSLVASDGSLYLIGSTTDVTELRRREEELRVAEQKAVLADRAKSEFLANMSHEIRTPMNGVMGMAELMAKTELSDKQRTFVDIIMKSGNALLTIINDILDFSKIDSGQLVLDPAPFNLAEAIEDVATLVSARAKEKDLEMIVRVDPALPETLVGDVGRIRQIITNLLGNAVKFTEKGHVLVDVAGRSDAQSTHLHFQVKDTGIGIPREKLELIFDKFSQVDASSTRKHEGTGLGLAITSRLVEMMGGTLGVESEAGKGSTFRFEVTLPNADSQGRSRVTPSDITGARVLVVDDNEVNRSILAEQMASWGFDSCAACNGREGLKVLEAAAGHGLCVDCVVLDYQMPGMNGAEVARAIRSTRDIAATPIVLLTSVDHSLSGAVCRELAIDAQLTKPARSSALLETIVTTIQKARSDEAGWGYAGAGSGREEHANTTEDGPGYVAHPCTLPDGAAEDGAGAAVQATKHPVEILVAEDNEVNQLVFSQILGEAGLSFEIVENGKRAVEAWRALAPRMILMDVSMPELNGLEATQAIREAEAGSGRNVPIIGVTAHALKGDRERCLEAGMDDYLSKPISPRALTEKVERWCPNRRRAAR